MFVQAHLCCRLLARTHPQIRADKRRIFNSIRAGQLEPPVAPMGKGVDPYSWLKADNEVSVILSLLDRSENQ